MSRNARYLLTRRHFLGMGASLLAASRLGFAQIQSAALARTGFLEYEDVAPLLAAGEVALPSDLARLTKEEMREQWPSWLRGRDLQTRSRLLRGEEDTLVNFVLFGVSFTDLPRAGRSGSVTPLSSELIDARIRDFVSALANTSGNERLQSLRKLLQSLGHDTNTAQRQASLTEYVLASVSRYRAEDEQYRAAVERVSNADSADTLALTSQLYSGRGLSLDTDFRPNYAIEQALIEAKRRGLLGSVRRVAVIGPGLDFTDKDSGFDHYPLQTLQPFAVIDSLIRLGLSREEDLRVTALDISAQTLDHIAQAVMRARAGQGYSLELVLDSSLPWNREALAYWRSFGSGIGAPSEPQPLPPQLAGMERRAMRIRPEIVSSLEPESLNVVAQRLELAPAERFDLVIATNILIYYGEFEQALALLNIDAMMAAGSIFLTNDLFKDFSGIRLRGVGSVTATYAGGQSDSVRIYARPTFQLQLPPA